MDGSALKPADFEEALGYLNSGKISKEAVIEILVEKLQGRKIDLAKYAGVSDRELEQEIRKIVAEKKGLSTGAYMGIVMQKFRGKVDGKKVSEILKKLA
jgi:glutamyl-tRNA(Gln) amidotransferase subunit E